MKTLVIHNGIIKGITEQELTVGDVVTLDENDPLPLVVYLVQERPKKVGYNPDADPNQLIVPEDQEDGNSVDVDWDGDFDRVAYLNYNEKAGAKYTKKTSQRLEKRMAQTLGGSVTPGSGAFVGHKGDVRASEWLGEHKYTDAHSYRLQRVKVWEKIAREAFTVNKTPVLEVILDQSKAHLRIIFMEVNTFIEKTNATEDQLLALCYFTQLKAKEGKDSVNLELDNLQNGINEALTLGHGKVPAILLTFDPTLTLIGFLAKDFEIIFAPEDDPKPPKKAQSLKPKRPKIERPKSERPKPPKKAWPKRPFPTRKKKTEE